MSKSMCFMQQRDSPDEGVGEEADSEDENTESCNKNTVLGKVRS